MRPSWYSERGKRLLDVGLAALLVPVAVPLMIGLAIAVRVALGSPVFFRQRRPGLHGVPFQLVKFRSMSDERDASGGLLDDGRRLGRFGRFLRATSLDELPELLNVLRGDMSLVGPRPLLMQYLERYSSEQARRHEVRPGITGWAQVHGRNALTWPEKFRLDVWYVDHVTARLDLQILVRTVGKIWRREGISQPGHDTAREFLGED